MCNIYKDNVDSAACLSQIILYIHFVLVREKKKMQALKKEEEAVFLL